MDKERNREFVRKIEGLVNPADVTAISFLGDFNRLLPRAAQRRIMKKGSEGIPYMGFVVDPYCFFVSYGIKDPAAAAALMPPEYELLETSMFAGDAKGFRMVFSVFSARTSAFAGTRLETYLIARRKKDGRASWIIIDYVTDTNSYDPAQGFSGYNGDPVLFTTTPYGELLADIAKKPGKPRFALRAEITQGSPEGLDQTLWVEGNMAVNYGGALRDPSATEFGLIFDPRLMVEALRIPARSVAVLENSFYPDLIDQGAPLAFACFPYGQHYIIKQDLPPGGIRETRDLEERAAEFVAARGFKTMRGTDLKRPIGIGMLASAIVTYGIIAILAIIALR